MPALQDQDSATKMVDDGAKSADKSSACRFAETRRGICLQIFVGVIANLGSLSPGMSLGYSAIALPQMTSQNSSDFQNMTSQNSSDFQNMTSQNNSDFYLDSDQASWFAGLAAVAMPLGCLVSGPLMDRLGRRSTLLLLNVPCLLGWLLIGSVAQRPGPGAIAQLYVGRLLTGLATGMSSVPATIYLAEVSATGPMRSVLVTWTSISIAAGVLLVYILGAIFTHSWRLIANICAIFPLVAFASTFVLLPESPVWLLSQGRPEPALRALTTLRGASGSGSPRRRHSVQAEFEQMSLKLQANLAKNDTKQTLGNNIAYLLTAPEAYKPLLIMNGYFLFQQASGVFVVIFYAVDFAHEAGVTIDGYLASVLIGAMRLVITVLVSVVSNKCGRRPLSILSGVGMTLSLTFLAACLLLGKSDGDGGVAAVAALLGYIAAATCGFLTLPWAMLGEVFPGRVRALAGGLTTCLAYVFSFVMVKSYPAMRRAMGEGNSAGAAGVFFFYAAMSALGTAFVALLLPETRGRSIDDIARHFAPAPAPASGANGASGGSGTSRLARENGLDLPLLNGSSGAAATVVPVRRT